MKKMILFNMMLLASCAAYGSAEESAGKKVDDYNTAFTQWLKTKSAKTKNLSTIAHFGRIVVETGAFQGAMPEDKNNVCREYINAVTLQQLEPNNSIVTEFITTSYHHHRNTLAISACLQEWQDEVEFAQFKKAARKAKRLAQ